MISFYRIVNLSGNFECLVLNLHSLKTGLFRLISLVNEGFANGTDCVQDCFACLIMDNVVKLK